jgi:hypothetical protein
MARTEFRLSTGERRVKPGYREHHIGRFNPSHAMLRRIRSDLEENHEPGRRYAAQLDERD